MIPIFQNRDEFSGAMDKKIDGDISLGFSLLFAFGFVRPLNRKIIPNREGV